MNHTEQTADLPLNDFFSGLRCLVTGGAGFIGTHLCQRLARAGASIVVFDLAQRSERSLLAARGLLNRLDYVQGDVRSRRDLSKLAGPRFDFVFHLAGQPISSLSNLEPQATIDVNAGGTRTLCDILANSNATIVLASSACAYGIPMAGASPLSEREPLRKGFYAYTESKQKAERQLQNAKGIHGVIGRFVNVYGPGDRHFSRIIPRTIRQLLGGSPLSLSRGDGTTVLDFLYIDDAVEAFLMLARYASTHSNSEAEVFNFGIGRRNATSIQDLVRLISELYDGSVRDVLPKAPLVEPTMVKFLDPSKAHDELNWTPQVLLDVGLMKTIDWYRKHINDLTHLEDSEYPPAFIPIEARPLATNELTPVPA